MSVHTFVCLHINFYLWRHFGAEPVLINDFVSDVVNFESNIFRLLKWSVEAEVANVCCHKSCSFGGYNAVEK